MPAWWGTIRIVFNHKFRPLQLKGVIFLEWTCAIKILCISAVAYWRHPQVVHAARSHKLSSQTLAATTKQEVKQIRMRSKTMTMVLMTMVFFKISSHYVSKMILRRSFWAVVCEFYSSFYFFLNLAFVAMSGYAHNLATRCRLLRCYYSRRNGCVCLLRPLQQKAKNLLSRANNYTTGPLLFCGQCKVSKLVHNLTSNFCCIVFFH